MDQKDFDFTIIGAGLAGSEAALTLANHGARVRIFEQKPVRFSAAHRLSGAAELVCSNSFKSEDPNSAHGLLKAELRELGSPLLQLADLAKVPGGSALSVDREKLSELVTKELEENPFVDFRREAIDQLPQSSKDCLIATGPLTSESLMTDIKSLLNDDGLYFYDATSPVLTLESLDMEYFFWGSRRDLDGSDYLNLPLDKEEYENFREAVLAAEKVEAHLPDEKLQYFEGCLPIEVLAERGKDTLAFSCMKPVGLPSHRGKKAYAVIQFRREKAAGDLLNMVGFQTRMKWPAQQKVFKSLPGMANADFVRLGAMHRNSFINAPKHLTHELRLRKTPEFLMAGQITGSEGYSEALASGHYAALQMLKVSAMPENSAIRSLVRYLIESDPKYFQPMNFNFGLLPPLDVKMEGKRRLGKRERNQQRAQRALEDLRSWKNSESLFKNIWTEKNSQKNIPLTASAPKR